MAYFIDNIFEIVKDYLKISLSLCFFFSFSLSSIFLSLRYLKKIIPDILRAYAIWDFQSFAN